jgi:hypothetical protein
MAEQQGRPLWEVMRDAYDTSSVPADLVEACDPQTGDWLTDRYGYAAELRAIADEVAPESPPPEDHADATDWHAWSATHEIRALLLAEAERAEKGDANG